MKKSILGLSFNTIISPSRLADEVNTYALFWSLILQYKGGDPKNVKVQILDQNVTFRCVAYSDLNIIPLQAKREGR